MKKPLFISMTAGLAVTFMPRLAFAHEVYVLPPGQVNLDIKKASFDMAAIILQNFPQFVFWFFVFVAGIAGIFCISMFLPLRKFAHPLILSLKKYAPFIARMTIGLAFLACAYYQATFGPELPLKGEFGAFSGLVTAVFIIIGIMIIIGLYSRLAAVAALVIFCITVLAHGIYMLTYANYLGEIIVLLILGSHNFSLDNWLAKNRAKSNMLPGTISSAIKKITSYVAPHSFAILRVLFGVALIFASAYAKIFHNYLALNTVNDYHLDKILGFESHFLVVGAALTELLIGVFFIIGFEIRAVSLFLLFWLTLSLIFFGEVVWPHLILIGIPIAVICYGYDRYSLGWHLTKDKNYEPAL